VPSGNAINITSFNATEWKAFWINAYNYLAVRVILDHACATDLFGDCRPLKSIKEIGEQQPSLFVLIWSMPVLQIKSYNGGALLTLDNIEDNLRTPPAPFIEDVRIHGCIVCASVSCPNLRKNAYTTQGLDQEMSDNVAMWLANPKKGSTASGNAITVSAIFNWFADDFTNSSGKSNSASVKDFLMLHGPLPVRQALNSSSNSITYFDYNWNLNGNIDGLCAAQRPCFPWWALLCLILGLLVVVLVSVLCIRKRPNYTQIN